MRLSDIKTAVRPPTLAHMTISLELLLNLQLLMFDSKDAPGILLIHLGDLIYQLFS